MSTRRGGVRVPVDGDVTGLNRALAQADTALGRFGQRQEAFGRRMGATGRTLTRNLTLPIVGAGVAAGKLAFDFQTSMTTIGALVGVNQKQVGEWGKAILDLAPKVGKSPKELADALYFITSSGIAANKTLGALTISAKLSASGLGETEGIADGLTSAINAYAASNLTAAKAGDIFAATVREGKAEASDIAPVLGNVLPVAAELGISFDQVGASVAAMTLQGTDAETAITNLSGIFGSFLKPSVQGAKALKDVGLSAAEVRKEMKDKGLLDTLQLLRDRFKGNHEELAKVLPNVRALRGFLQLTGGDVEATEKLFERLAGATGDTNKAFEETAKSGPFKLRQSMARLQAEGIKIGDVLLPIAADAAEKFGEMLDAIDGLSSGQKKLAGWGVVALAALGPVARVIGGVSQGVGLLSRGVGSLAGLAGKGGTAATTVGGMAGVQKVWVVNLGPGGMGGAGPVGVGARAGAAARVGAVVPGIGTLATGGIAAPLLAGAALIGGGMVANKVIGQTGIPGGILPSADEARRATEKAQEAVVLAWRKGRTALQAEIQKSVVVPAGPIADRFADAADKSVDSFRAAVTKGGPKARVGAKRMTEAAIEGLDGLEPAAQRIAADSMIRMARSLEDNGRAPKGATVALLNAIEGRIGRLPEATRTAASAAAAAFRALLPAISSVRDGVANLYDLIRNPPTPRVTLPSVPGGGGGGKGGGPAPKSPFSKSADAVTRGITPRRGELNPITASDRAFATIAARHRDDSLQDTITRERAAAGAAGITNPDKIAALQDRAVAQVRKKEITADSASVQTAISRVVGKIKAKRKALVTARQKRRRTPSKRKDGSSNPAYSKLTQSIDGIRDAIRTLWDEHRALIREHAELRAEAAELGHTIATLNTEVASLPDVIPDEDTAVADTTTAGPSPDQQAQLDQANARASAAENESKAFGAFVSGLRGSGDIDPARGVTVVQHVYGSVVMESQAASWIVEAMNRQGNRTASVSRSAA